MRRFRAGLSLLCALGWAGCAARVAPAGTGFQAAGSGLDRDGAVLAVVSGAELRAACDRAAAAWETALWERGQVDTATRGQALREVLQFRFWAQLIGLEHLRWAGYSAKRLPPPGRDGFHTELFLALPPDAPGLLNAFFAPTNTLRFRETLTALPRSTELALAADLRPGEILKALRHAGVWGERIVLELEAFWPLLEDTSGVWRLLQIRRPGRTDAEYVLELPDPNGKLGGLPAEFLRQVLPEAAELVKGDRRVTIYSSPAVKAYLRDPHTLKLGDNADFARWFSRMPETGFFWLYQGENFSAADLLGGVATVPTVPRPALLTAVRTPDGIRLAANSGSGLLELLLRRLLSAQLPEAEEEEETPPAPGPNQTENCACAAALRQLKERTQRSPVPGTPGLRACFGGAVPAETAAAIVYFGSSEKGDTPLAISAPGRHNNRFHVLFNDGTLKTYRLEKPDSCRRIVSFLQTEKRWEEKVWRQLMDLAARMDAGSVK